MTSQQSGEGKSQGVYLVITEKLANTFLYFVTANILCHLKRAS